MDLDGLSVCAEEAGLNAWPALREIFYDGWLIRLAEGHARRTNSVNVIGAGRRALAGKIDHCESVYRAHGLPAYFRVRSNQEPELDKELAARGFRAEDETLTLFLDFGATPPNMPSRAVEIAGKPPGEDWLRANARFTGKTEEQVRIRRRLLDLVALPVAFAALRDEESRIVSVAYGAVHDRLVSLQWVATDPGCRRSGYSHATLSALLCWARERGAEGACLQVVASNRPAIKLYESLGFDRELYRYHYRVR